MIQNTRSHAETGIAQKDAYATPDGGSDGGHVVCQVFFEDRGIVRGSSQVEDDVDVGGFHML